MSGTPPLVHVVVVDYDGGDLTIECLRSLVAGDWPADRLRIVLVDNASRAPVADVVRAELPDVRYVRSEVNLGFAGGVNLGLRERAGADFVALVNNDATVSTGWLGPLMRTLEDPRVGAACPKILLASPAIEMTLRSTTSRRRGDRRPLGVRVSGARVAGRDVGSRVQLVDGFWGPEPMPAGEPGGQWTGATADLRVPVSTPDPSPPALELRLGADVATGVTVVSGTRTTALTVGPGVAWHAVASDATPVEVINNVGNVVHPDGYAADRGWLEVDRGQYDTPADVDAWCGAAVLLRRDYLDDVGHLDERLFMYYEDVELSLRGATRGWRYRTAPESVVRHVHSATSVAGSPRSFHYNERNRLVVLGASQPPARAGRALARHAAITASYAGRDVVGPLLRGSRPRPEIVARRVRALGAAAIRIPGARRRARGRATPAMPH